MIRIGILGNIGSGKSFISKLFDSPVFNADRVVNYIYKKKSNANLQQNQNTRKFSETNANLSTSGSTTIPKSAFSFITNSDKSVKFSFRGSGL